MLNAPFSSLAEFKKLLMKQPNSNLEIKNQASERNNQLTKPPGSLGRLEELAIWYSSWRGEVTPKLRFPQIVVFAGNHGVTTQGISAFPSEVTQQMVMNFQHGGAAINQLCKVFGVKLNVIALDLDNPTADLTTGPAMSEAECVKALTIGWNAVDKSTDLFVAGEIDRKSVV